MPDVQDIFNYELKDLQVNLIDTGTRMRKDFGDVDALAADIGEFGLHHPILVLEKSYVNGLADHSEDGHDPDKPYLLLAGERRLRAVMKNKWAEVPAKITQREMSEWEIRIIELHENLLRKSMSPAEEVRLKDEIHSLYQGIYGPKGPGPGAEGHSLADTARMLGESKATVSQDLEVAKYLDVIPELHDAKTKSDARKMVKALKDKLVREEIARREEAKAQSNGKAKEQSKKEGRKSLLLQRYVEGNFFEEVKNVDARTVDLIELDPDWGILFKESVQRRGALTANDYDTLSPEDYEEAIKEVCRESFRILKDNAWAIVWYSMEDWHDVTRRALEEVGFSVCPMPAFWIHTSNYTGTPAYRLGQRTESFFYARKGSPRISKMGHPNTFTFRTLEKDERTHPAEKPIELYMDILQTFIGERKAATCISGFGGSGNFVLAADNLEHNAVCFDTSKKFRDDYVLKVTQGEVGEYRSYKA